MNSLLLDHLCLLNLLCEAHKVVLLLDKSLGLLSFKLILKKLRHLAHLLAKLCYSLCTILGNLVKRDVEVLEILHDLVKTLLLI